MHSLSRTPDDGSHGRERIAVQLLTGFVVLALFACSSADDVAPTGAADPTSTPGSAVTSALPSTSTRAPGSGPTRLDIEIIDGRLSARLENAPGDEVLDFISREADVEFVFIGGRADPAPITITIDDATLEDGIGALLGVGRNAFVYQGTGDARRLDRVFVLEQGPRSTESGAPVAMPAQIAPELAEAIANVRREVERQDPEALRRNPIDEHRLEEIRAQLEATLRTQLPPEALERMGWDTLPPDERSP